jgi:DNA repair protein RecO (recombination protein O)
MTLGLTEQEAEEQLSLILNGLYLLSESKRNELLVKACVEIRLMCLAGYMPDLTMCKDCGEYQADTMVFLPETGRITCKNCYDLSPMGHRIYMNEAVTTALRHCCYADKEKLFSFSLPEQDLKTLNFCSEEYMRFMLEREFSTLQFLKSIL